MSAVSAEYRFYLKQNIGARPEPVVRTGDHVERGERIAAKPQGLGAALHSSVTGTVVRVTEDEIAVRDTGTDFSSYKKLAGKTPWERVEEAGLVGLGGAGFPTAEKLKSRLGADGTVVINAAECEPILCHNIARIEETAGVLLDALQIVLELTGAKNGIVAVKRGNAKAVAALKAANSGGKYRIALLEDLYPTGEERAVVRDTLGVLLPPEALPSRADAVVINAETALRIREAVVLQKPLIDKDMTVAGKLRENAGVRVLKDVPVGTPVSDVFELAGGFGSEYGELIMGGPFTGSRTSLTEAVRKTTGGLLAAECFPKGPEKLGLLVCACGADEDRMREIARGLESGVCGVAYCKQAVRVKNAYKCENPGHCPGQIQKVMELKKQGAQALLIGNCTDCSNTVMACAPKLNLKVYHTTDQALRAVNHPLVRRIHSDEKNGKNRSEADVYDD